MIRLPLPWKIRVPSRVSTACGVYFYGDLSLSPGTVLPGTAGRSKSASWTDGIVGVRGTYVKTSGIFAGLGIQF